MHQLLAVVSMAVLMSAGTAAWAQNSTVNKTPGHMMQDPKCPSENILNLLNRL